MTTNGSQEMSNVTDKIIDNLYSYVTDSSSHISLTTAPYNFSNINTTEDLSLHVNGSDTDGSSISKTLVIPSAMFFFGVIGNVTALLILTIRPSKDSKATAFYHLVKALVCMDLFGIVALSPVTILLYIKGGILHTGGMPLCHYFSFVLLMAGNATLFTVLVMAAERFMVTKYPFKYSRIVTPLAVNICIAVVWGLSTLIAVLPIIGVGQNVAQWPGTWCFFDYRATDIGGQLYSYIYAALGLLAIAITIVLNLFVAQLLWRMRRSRLISSSFRSSTRSSPSHPTNSGSGPDSEKRMVIFLMAIIVVFTVCYAPFMIRIIWNQLFNTGLPPMYGGVDDNIDLWVLRLASLNQILDPWVYIISRVTCCKGSRDRDEMSHSVRSYHSVHATHANTVNSHQLQSSEKRIVRAIRNVRSLFHMRKEELAGKDSVTIPLQSPQKGRQKSTPSTFDKQSSEIKLKPEDSSQNGDQLCNGYHI